MKQLDLAILQCMNILKHHFVHQKFMYFQLIKPNLQKFYRKIAITICLCVGYSCFNSTIAEQSNCNRNHMTPKFYSIYNLALYKKKNCQWLPQEIAKWKDRSSLNPQITQMPSNLDQRLWCCYMRKKLLFYLNNFLGPSKIAT